MSKLKFLVFYILAEAGFSYTVPVDLIMQEMVKGGLPTTPVSFQATIMKNGEARFVDLKLDDNQSEAWATLMSLEKKGVSGLKTYLAQAGIDLTVVSQGLFAYEPIFIIGAGPNNDSLPQIWIHKATFLPVKIVAHGRVITFDKWTALELVPGKKFPSVIKTAMGSIVETMSISEKIFR